MKKLLFIITVTAAPFIHPMQLGSAGSAFEHFKRNNHQLIANPASHSDAPSPVPAPKKSPCTKRFKCDHPGCEYATSQSSNLKTHKRTHTGEKPYQCTYPECEYATAKSSNLKTHKRTHTGEKPYQCTYPGCEYATAQSSDLKKHIRSHTGEKPYQCDHPGCEYATSQSSNLNRHIKTNHLDLAIQQRRERSPGRKNTNRSCTDRDYRNII